MHDNAGEGKLFGLNTNDSKQDCMITNYIPFPVKHSILYVYW